MKEPRESPHLLNLHYHDYLNLNRQESKHSIQLSFYVCVEMKIK